MPRINLSKLGAGVLLSIALGVIAVASRATLENPAAAASTPQSQIVFVQAPVVAGGNLVDRFPQGSRLVRLEPAKHPGKVISLTGDFFAARDPQISFDGNKILFAARKTPEARWQVWEMNSDGTAKRQVTHCAADCLRPAYLARDQIVYTVVGSRGSGANSQVFIAQLDGGEERPITFGPGDFQVETVLRDGRILVSASSPLLEGSESANSRQLYTVRLDGTALAAFRCDHRERALRDQATELDDGSLVFIKANGGGEIGGQLAEIRRGGLHNSSLSHVRELFWSPRSFGSQKLIVARKNSAAPAGAAKFDLYAFDSDKGEFGDPVYEDPKLSSVQAVPVAPRPVPRWFWSIVKPESKAGYFICLNSHLASDLPGNRIESPVAQVRVLTLDPETNQERALGTTAVEEDGSFYVAVPPDRPMRFELLSPEGRVIRAQRSWIWTRPGEEAACVGCHEDKAVAPPNRWPQALRRLDTPIHLGVEPTPEAAH